MADQDQQQNAKIHNVRIDSQFTTTFNETSQNNSLSFSARGLLWYLLSLPENWNVSRKHLYKVYTGEERGNGRTAIDRMFRELMDQEYIVYTVEKDEKGHWVHRYDVYPMPFPRFQKMFPDAGNQRADNQSAVNGGSNTKQQFRTKQPKKELFVADDPSGSPPEKIFVKKSDGGHDEVLLSDLWRKAVKNGQNWTTEEIHYAWSVLASYKSVVHDWWRFIEGTIQKHRNLKKSQNAMKGESKCKSKKKTTELVKCKGSSSASATSEQVSRNCGGLLMNLLKE